MIADNPNDSQDNGNGNGNGNDNGTDSNKMPDGSSQNAPPVSQQHAGTTLTPHINRSLFVATPIELIEALAATWHEDDIRIERQMGKPIDWRSHTVGLDRRRVLERAARYMERVDGAVSGRGGHHATYRAAAILVEKFDLSVQEAFPLLEVWNQKCSPPWESHDLLRKLNEVDAKETGQRGLYLRELAREQLRSQFVPSSLVEVFEYGAGANGAGQLGGDSAGNTGGNSGSNGSGSAATSQPPSTAPGAIRVFSNYYDHEYETDDGRTRRERRGYSIHYLGALLARLTNGWPKRVGDQLFTARPDHRPQWLKSSSALFAWIGQQLNTDGRTNPLQWAKGHDKVSESQFFDYLTQTVESVDAVEMYPHEPPMPRQHYIHPPLEGGDGSAIAELLARFSPASGADADLLLAFFMSLVWGGSCGHRPIWIFTADESDVKTGRGTGKSTVATIGSQLVGGFIGLSANQPITDVQTRLLSAKGMESRVALLDNVKSLRFSWSDLEAIITAPVLSGRQLYVGEGQRPNTLSWAITFNGATLSRDLAQRSIIVKVARPVYTCDWEDETRRLVETKRWQIIGDLVARLRRPTERISVTSRWGPWEQNVLAKVDDLARCQAVIAERANNADDDTEEMELVRDAIVKLLVNYGLQPDTAHIVIPSALAAEVVVDATGEKRAVNKAMTYLYTLGVPEIKRHRSEKMRGCVWKGVKATTAQPSGMPSEKTEPPNNDYRSKRSKDFGDDV